MLNRLWVISEYLRLSVSVLLIDLDVFDRGDWVYRLEEVLIQMRLLIGRLVCSFVVVRQLGAGCARDQGTDKHDLCRNSGNWQDCELAIDECERRTTNWIPLIVKYHRVYQVSASGTQGLTVRVLVISKFVTGRFDSFEVASQERHAEFETSLDMKIHLRRTC